MTLTTKIGTIALAALATAFSFPSTAGSVPDPAPDPYIPEARIERALNHGPFNEQDLRGMVRAIGAKKGLTPEQIRQVEVTIGGDGVRMRGECATGESNWDPSAIGDGGKSHGLVQIYGQAHPHISTAEASDATFAVNFIVDEFLAGNEWKWTCWRSYFD